MLPLWLQFKRWVRKLLVTLSLGKPVDWIDTADELGRIIKQVEQKPEPPRRRLFRRRMDA